MNVDDFINFLDECPTQFHFCSYTRSELLKNGFVELKESEEWKEVPKKAFFIRDEREVVAWNDSGHNRAIIAGAHCDFPCLILKPKFDEIIGGYRRCRCNTYGTGLWYTWLDRDLRLAGRVLIKNSISGPIKSVLFDSKTGIATIPCIAPQLDSEFGASNPINADTNLIPIYGIESQTPPLLDYVASKLNVDSKNIVSYDLHFIDSEPSSKIFNQDDSIIQSQKLNGLHNSYAVLKSFINSNPEEGTISMIAIFDNEETGSKSRASAASDAINSALQRILRFNSSDYRCFKANSFFINCKSFHAQNQNFAANGVFRQIRLGNGICMQRSSVIKSVSSPKNDYSIVEAIKKIFVESSIEKDDDQSIENKNVCVDDHQFCYPCQNVPSTSFQSKGEKALLGAVVENKFGILSIDIGAPLIGMNSIRELGSFKDIEYEFAILSELFTNYSKYAFPL